jgi:hypothetical protein
MQILIGQSLFVTVKEVMFYVIWMEFVLPNVILIFNQQIKRIKFLVCSAGSI